MEKMSPSKKQLSNKSLVQERMLDLLKYKDRSWQVPKYGMRSTVPKDKCSRCG